MFESRTHYDRDNKIWHGSIVQPLFSPKVSVGQVIITMLMRDKSKVLQINGKTGAKKTGQELCDLTLRAATNLQKKGLQQEDIIGIIASNSDNLAPIVFGAFLVGNPINTLDPSFNKGEIKHMFGITRPKLIFCDAEIYSTVNEAIKEINLNSPIYTFKGKVNYVGTAEDFFNKCDEEKDFLPPQLKNGGEQTAAILCSSGTTGLPKGVSISHEMILNQTIYPILNSAVAFCFSTLYWLTGLFTLVIGTISGSTRIIVDEPFNADLLLRVVEEYRVKFLMTPPSQMALLLNHPGLEKRDLSSIETYLCGGSAVPAQLSATMETYLPNGQIRVGYGMTEIAGVCSNENSLRKRGSVGQIQFNTEIKIIDDNGKCLNVGENGEICIRTIYHKCKGYHNNAEATKALFDEDGWIHSGDIGHFDDDGFLFIVDRKKEILKYKNFHFFPTEIETVIRELSDVVDVCVFGLPDIIATDLPAAAIVKKANSNLTAEEVYDYVASKMSDFKNLRGGVYFFETLPMTASGKVQRRKVLEIVRKLKQEKVLE